MRGVFIVLEGIDGSGKGTLCRLLHERLLKEGCKSVLTEEPTRKETGQLLRAYLRREDISSETLALLFAADRREHLKDVERHLSEGSTVISERYLFSSLAYQCSQGLDEEWIWEINRFAIMPDAALLLDLSPEIALERLRKSRGDREVFESLEFLEKVRQKYLEIFEREDERFKGVIRFIVNAERPLEEVFEEAWRKLGGVIFGNP